METISGFLMGLGITMLIIPSFMVAGFNIQVSTGPDIVINDETYVCEIKK